MSNSTFPLDPAHPLAVGSDLLQTHGLLLYSGQMTGRWFNVTTTTTRGSRQPVTVTERQLDVAGTGRVTLELSPDPHFDWLFAHDGLVPVHQWPVGGEFVGIRHRSIFGSREPGVPREVVAMA